VADEVPVEVDEVLIAVEEYDCEGYQEGETCCRQETYDDLFFGVLAWVYFSRSRLGWAYAYACDIWVCFNFLVLGRAVYRKLCAIEKFPAHG
jgi:hypothetical protein